MSRIRTSASRPARCTRTPTDTLSTASRFTADRCGTATALIYNHRTWTWQEVREQANRLAGGLARLGVRRGERVVMTLPNCPEFVAAFFAIQKLGAVLVNCGRGGLLDLDAAHAALLDGRLSGVGLDVFEPEPPADHPLFHHPDVVLTPHVMALSRRARALVFEEMAAGMDDVLSGRRAPFVANPDVYDTARTP